MRFNDNHSTGYSMIGYTCAYLRYYHPVEFITAYLQNSGNDNDTIQGANLAKQLGIMISPIKFRHSGIKYTCDSINKVIYKPVNSLKGFGSDIAVKLYNLKNQKYDSFIDYLKDNPCGKYTEKLIKLNFFSEFGKSQQLLDIYNLYDKFGKRKQINKSDCPIEESVMLNYATATEKQYKIFDNIGFMSELCKNIEDKDIPITEQLKTQAEFLGYLDYVNPNIKNTGYVINVDTKYSPKITLYCLDTGKTIIYKVSKKDYNTRPIIKNSIIKIQSQSRYKTKMINGEWVKSKDETEPWIINYQDITYQYN